MTTFYNVVMTSVSLSCLATTLFAYSTSPQGFSTSDQAALSQALGGACYTCRSENYCRKRTECKRLGKGAWLELIGTGITQKFCYDMKHDNSTMNGAGKTKCVADTYKVCVKVKLCTGRNCTNCGQKSTESKTTNCDFSGGANCTVRKPVVVGRFKSVGI